MMKMDLPDWYILWAASALLLAVLIFKFSIPTLVFFFVLAALALVYILRKGD